MKWVLQTLLVLTHAVCLAGNNINRGGINLRVERLYQSRNMLFLSAKLEVQSSLCDNIVH